MLPACGSSVSPELSLWPCPGPQGSVYTVTRLPSERPKGRHQVLSAWPSALEVVIPLSQRGGRKLASYPALDSCMLCCLPAPAPRGL